MVRFVPNQNYIFAPVMSKENSIEINQEIFQEMVKLYSETYNMPPLSAKIFSYLIFDFEKKGVCFDAFVEVFSASKSSVSANVNYLLNAGFIYDINKIDERKRYFLVNNDYIKIRFNQIVSRLKREIDILDKLEAFREDKSEGSSDKIVAYKTLLFKNIQNIEETLPKFN